MSPARFIRALLLWLSLPVLSPLAFGQTSETGLPPYGSFQGSGLDVVSLENGNLHMEIPIFSVHQRAFPDRTYNFQYDIPGWQVDESQTTPTTFKWIVAPAPHQLSGWHLLTNLVAPWHVDHDIVPKTCTDNLGSVHQYNVHTNYVLTDSHGTTHPFEVRHVDQPASGCADPVGNQNTGVALDGSGITIAIGSNAYSTTISMPDDYGPLNGNSFGIGGASETDQNDANGRLITTTWTYSDSSGTPQQIRVDFTSVSFLTHFCSLINVGTSPCVEASVTSQLPQKLTLPTGKYYFFTWSTDGNGDLLRLDLPTGGYFAYTYQSYTKFLGNTYAPSSGGRGRGTGPALGHYRGRRQIKTRTVSDGTTANTWAYNGFTVTDPLGNDEVHTFTAMGDPPNPPRYETQILYYQGSSSSGTLLKTINKDYAYEVSSPEPDAIDHGFINIRLSRVTTILDNGLQTKAETDYETFQQIADPTFGFTVTRLNPIETREYAYGAGAPGALLRRTDYTYLHTGNQNYLSRNIVRQVATTTVYDGSSIRLAQTVNEYDNYFHPGQPMLASNAIQHDPTYSTSFIYRGNLTAVSHWRNTDGALLTTTNQYDDAGNLLSTIGPLGHKTSFDYTDSWGNTSCIPSGQAKIFVTTITNALNQSVTKSYNSCTGTLASATDPNNLTTSFGYDLMNRLTAANFPDGGQTSNCFTDFGGTSCTQGQPPLLIVTSKKINSVPTNLVTTQTLDGLARIKQSQLNSDLQGTDFTDTTYDALGRVATVSNPHRSTGSSTDGTTTYAYDALNRPTSVALQDNSVLSTSYTGNCVTLTDPAGKSRKSCSDALGRLTGVWEDPAGLNLETDYSYDALNNLLSVVQAGSSQRSFVYNSLSQLTQAANPESGTINYTYDADGNLQTKQDARGITTTYSYDALNRLTLKSYSDGTPVADYTYDQCPACAPAPTANGIGRLVHASNDVNAASTYSYDAMGRILQKQGCLPLNCSQTAFPVIATYDLAGDLLTESNGASVTFSYTYDGAARPTSLTSSLVDSQHPATLVSVDSGIGYYPTGAIRKMTYGNGLTQAASIEPRLQPCRINLNSSGAYITDGCADGPVSGTIQDFDYDYGNWGSTNNGNVTAMDAAGAQNFGRSYTYDSLNRIATMSAPGDSCSGLSWTYDPWGNRTAQTATGGSCYQQSSTTFSSKNQLPPPYQYDAAGNMTYDGTHTYAYDAENRLTQVDGGATATYVYDAEGRRVQKTTGGATTDYVYDLSGNVIAEMNSSGWLRGYAYLAGQTIAEYFNGTTYFVHTDQLGSTRLLTGLDQGVVQNLDYLPYGELTSSDSGLDTHKFTGKERDTESGLDMFGARYYGSSLGRFMTPDWAAKPITVPYANFGNPQSLNLYSYVTNNPLTLLDDDGHDIIYAAGLQNSQLVKDSVQAILSNPHTSANLSGYVGPNSPNLTIQSGDLSAGDTRTVLPSGQTLTTTVQGNTAPDIQTSTVTSNGVTSAPETILTGATITIDNRTSKGDTPGVLVHESVHAGEAQADPAKFSKDAAAEKSLPHDQRPQEQRANAAQQAFGNEVKKEVKQIEKDRKKENQ